MNVQIKRVLSNLSAVVNPGVYRDAYQRAKFLSENMDEVMGDFRRAVGDFRDAAKNARVRNLNSLKGLGGSAMRTAGTFEDVGIASAFGRLGPVGRSIATLSNVLGMGGNLSLGDKAARLYGAYALADTASRVFGPATLTRDSNGNRDIVGVPFL